MCKLKVEKLFEHFDSTILLVISFFFFAQNAIRFDTVILYQFFDQRYTDLLFLFFVNFYMDTSFANNIFILLHLIIITFLILTFVIDIRCLVPTVLPTLYIRYIGASLDTGVLY